MDSRKLVFKETAIILCGEAVCVGAMIGIYALLGFYKTGVLLGGIVGAVVAAAKYPMRNPLEKIFGDLAGSWYDAHTVTGQAVWCAAAARACAKHPSQAGYSRNNLASYAANTTDYAAVMLPLASAGNSAGEVLKEAADNLNVTGWDSLADWSMLNRFAAQE